MTKITKKLLKVQEHFGKTCGTSLPCKRQSSNLHHEGGCKAGNCAPKDIQNDYGWKVESHDSTRQRVEPSSPTKHDDRIAGKRCTSLAHYNLVHSYIPMPQAMKIPDAKPAVDKEWEKLEKILAWDLTKVRNKSEVTDEARTKGAKVHFASLMDICHLKNAELEAKHQKYEGRVVLRGDIVKDDSGSHEVFTEQGSSASQMTAAKVMDIISRLPGCVGQAADAVPDFTHVKMEDGGTEAKGIDGHMSLKNAELEPWTRLVCVPDDCCKNNGRCCKITRLWRTSSWCSICLHSKCSSVWIRLPRHLWPKSWGNFGDPVVPLERNQHGHPFAGLLWERQFEEALSELGWEKIPNWEWMFVHRKTRVISVSMCGWHQNGWKEAECGSHVEENWWKHVYWRNHILSWPQNIWDALSVTANRMKQSLNSIRRCLSHVFLLEQQRIIAVAKKTYAQTVAWSHDMEGHARKCVERYCELAKKKVEQFFQSFKSLLGWSSIQAGRTWISWRIIESCSQIILKCFYFARIGRPDILWSANKLAIAVTKWTQACDRRLARLISYIHHTDSDNIVIWATLLSIVDWVYFKTQTLLATLRTQNLPLHQLDVQEVNVSIPQFYKIWNRFFGYWTAQESLPALDLGDIVFKVFSSTNNTARQNNLCGTGDHSINKTRTKTSTETRKREFERLLDVDFVPTNTFFSQWISSCTFL